MQPVQHVPALDATSEIVLDASPSTADLLDQQAADDPLWFHSMDVAYNEIQTCVAVDAHTCVGISGTTSTVSQTRDSLAALVTGFDSLLSQFIDVKLAHTGELSAAISACGNPDNYRSKAAISAGCADSGLANQLAFPSPEAAH